MKLTERTPDDDTGVELSCEVRTHKMSMLSLLVICRLATLVFFAAILLISPLLTMLSRDAVGSIPFLGSYRRYLHGWQMFAHAGSNICDVRMIVAAGGASYFALQFDDSAFGNEEEVARLLRECHPRHRDLATGGVQRFAHGNEGLLARRLRRMRGSGDVADAANWLCRAPGLRGMVNSQTPTNSGSGVQLDGQMRSYRDACAQLFRLHAMSEVDSFFKRRESSAASGTAQTADHHRVRLYLEARCGLEGAWRTVADPMVDACSDPSWRLDPRPKLEPYVHFSTAAGAVALYCVFACWMTLRQYGEHARNTEKENPTSQDSLRDASMIFYEVECKRATAVCLARILTPLVFWARYGDELQRLSPGGIHMALFACLSSVLMLVGFYSRASSFALGVAALYYRYHVPRVAEPLPAGYFRSTLVTHRKAYEPFGHHHCTALAYIPLFLAFTPCGSLLSIDRLLLGARARGSGNASEAKTNAGGSKLGRFLEDPLWGVFLLRLHFGAIYLFSVLGKMHPRWLCGDRAEMIMLNFFDTSSLAFYFEGSLRPLGLTAAQANALFRYVFLALTYGMIGVQVFLGMGCFACSPRSPVQGLLFLLVLVLHGSMYIVVSVYTFSVTMAVLALSLLDGEQVHGILVRLLGADPCERSVVGHDAKRSETRGSSSCRDEIHYLEKEGASERQTLRRRLVEGNSASSPRLS